MSRTIVGKRVGKRVSFGLLWLLGLVGTWVLGLAAEAAEGPRKPNIVLIFADDLGVNDLSCYGREDQPTPNLDRMAAEGIRFTCAYCSQPICSPSRAGILTGKNPARLHITTFLPGRADAKSQKLLHPKIRTALPLEEKTLAEHLKDAGYATACIGKWHLGGADFGPDKQGFDFVYAGKANTMPSATEGGKGEYELTEQATQFIEKHKDEPFFVYLPHNTPHIPLAAKPELVEKHAKAFNPTYAAMMETMDDCVELVLAKIKELGLDEQTIVIFTSDNGGLHVHESPKSPATHNSPYRGGKGFLYEGGLREPLIVRWPGHLKPLVSDVPLSHLDLVPTLLSLAGLPAVEGLDGIDQSKHWLGQGEPVPRKFLWHFPHYNNQGGRPSGAIREGDWKLITFYDTGRVELYNLRDDVSESHDVATDDVDRTAALHKLHETWCKEANVQTNTANPDFDESLFKKLYEDFDPSRPPSALTSAAMEEQMKEWRQLMNEVVRGNRAAKGDGGKKKK